MFYSIGSMFHQGLLIGLNFT